MIMNIDKLKIEKNDVLVITVSNSATKEEAYSILSNVKNELSKRSMENIVIITTPNIRLSTLSDDELDKIGLKRK